MTCALSTCLHVYIVLSHLSKHDHFLKACILHNIWKFYNKIKNCADTVFCLPLICVLDPKNSQILTFFYGAVETSRLT